MNGATNRMAAATSRFRPIALVVVLLASLALAACGVDDDDDPTPAPTAPPAPAVETPPAGGSAPPQASAAAGATPAAGAAPGGTPNPMANTVGRLAAGIAAAWPESSYRRVQISSASEPATAESGMASLSITDEVLYPGSVRRTIVDGGGVTSAEFVLTDGRLYARGDLVPSVFESGTAPETWIEVAGPLLTEGTAGANILTQLEALFTPRYSGISAEEQAREAVLAAETDVDGRACFVFQTAETTQTGERLEIAIALESNGRLCSVTTTGGGVDTVETFTFDAPVAIEAPPVGATPAASPVATPATPAATPAA